MKSMEYTHIEEDEFATFIAVDMKIEGTMKTRDTTLIKGRMEKTEVKGTLLCVADEGFLEGKVNTAYFVVSGTVAARISVSENLHVLKTGKVTGEIATVDITIDKGAQINGSCKMISAELLDAENNETKK